MQEKNVLLLAALLFVVSATVFAAWAEQPSGGGKGKRHDAYSPALGDPERKAILDVPRKRYGDVVFIVNYFKVKDGWAWISVAARSRDGGSRSEPESLLLQKINGRWQEAGGRATGLECEENPDCSDDERFFKKLQSKFPDMPTDILPYGGKGEPSPSYAGKTILDYYVLIPPELLGGRRYTIQTRDNAYTTYSVAGYAIRPLVMTEIGHLQILDKGTGGGSVKQEISFLETNEGNNILRVNLIQHDGVGPVCSLRFYTLDGFWTDVTSRYLPRITIASFLNERYLARHQQNMNLQPEGVVCVYEIREHDGPMFAHINLERFAQICPPTPESIALVKNIAYGNVRLIWDKGKNALTFSGKGDFDRIKQKELLSVIEARRRR